MFAGVGEMGRDLPGLAVYLYGPGRANEHTNPHMVASSNNDALVAAFRGELSRDEAREVGHIVQRSFEEQRRRDYKLSMTRRVAVGRRGGTGAYLSDRDPDKRAHVFHAYLALPAEDGQLRDEQWHDLAHGYMSQMFGRDAQQMEWIAVRHGLSSGGNDHIHVAVNLVKDDGSWASVHYSKKRSRDAARVLEERHDFLRPMQVREVDRALPSYTRAEQRRYADREPDMFPSRQLERIVRNAAMCATNEREFLTLLHNDGVSFAPRWAAGGTEKVVGYSVRLREDTDGVWRGGGKLARDLTLTQLRAGWNQAPSVEREALDLWRKVHTPPPRKAVATADTDKALADSTRFLKDWAARLATMDHSDTRAWSDEARRMSALLGDIGQHAPGQDGENMRWLSRHYARLAQSAPASPRRFTEAERAMRQTNLALRTATVARPGSWSAFMAQAMLTAQAVDDANRAHREATEARARAAQMRQIAQDRLAAVERRQREVNAAAERLKKRTYGRDDDVVVRSKAGPDRGYGR